MKKLMQPGHTLILFCMATMFVVTACSTTGMQRSEEVQSNMQSVDNDIKLIIVQLNAIGASLDELTKPGQADMKRAFDVFSDNASEIEKMEEDFSKHADELEESGEAYFDAWDKDSQQYDNPEIQQRSNERRETLGRTYNRITQNSVGIKEAFQTYVSDVNEIERFLSNDLTSEGMDAISVTANKVVNNGNHLVTELQNLQAAIEDARSEMLQS